MRATHALGLMLVVIIIGGIYSGIFTATEAAAMAAVYSFFVSVYVYKALKLEDVPRVLLLPMPLPIGY